MRVALLNTDQRIAQWFQRDYPEVIICQKADEQFLEAETLILNASYKIDDNDFGIISMWKKFLEVRKKRKKLVILGPTPFRSSNYLCINQMPENLETWIKDTWRVNQKPNYPESNKNSILQPLSKILHSHGDRAFQKLLIRVRDPLIKIEGEIKKGVHRESIKKTEPWKETLRLMANLSRIWALRQPYFILMPDYSKLKQFNGITEEWEKMRATFMLPNPRLSVQIMDYLEETVTDITGLYKMEELNHI